MDWFRCEKVTVCGLCGKRVRIGIWEPKHIQVEWCPRCGEVFTINKENITQAVLEHSQKLSAD